MEAQKHRKNTLKMALRNLDATACRMNYRIAMIN
jgi:hypothetical protein